MKMVTGTVEQSEAEYELNICLQIVTHLFQKHGNIDSIFKLFFSYFHARPSADRNKLNLRGTSRIYSILSLLEKFINPVVSRIPKSYR